MTHETYDNRPTNCRYRLQDEGKSYLRSGCVVSGCGGVFNPLCKPKPKEKPKMMTLSDIETISNLAQEYKSIQKQLGNLIYSVKNQDDDVSVSINPDYRDEASDATFTMKRSEIEVIVQRQLDTIRIKLMDHGFDPDL